MTQKQADLDALSAKLEDVTEKIKEASSALADWNKRLKSKKLSVKYYEKKGSTDGQSTSDEVATLCSAIENAFTCLKGKHRSTKAKMLIEGLLSGNILQGEAAKALNDVAPATTLLYGFTPVAAPREPLVHVPLSNTATAQLVLLNPLISSVSAQVKPTDKLLPPIVFSETNHVLLTKL